MLSPLQERVTSILRDLPEAETFVLVGGGALIARGDGAKGKGQLLLFGRAEARDFIDLAVLEPRFGLSYLCRRALDKDLGFRPAVLRTMLDRFSRLARDEFDVDDAGFERLCVTLSRWRAELDTSLEPPSGRPPPER